MTTFRHLQLSITVHALSSDACSLQSANLKTGRIPVQVLLIGTLEAQEVESLTVTEISTGTSL
jgi:hypothetical protein